MGLKHKMIAFFANTYLKLKSPEERIVRLTLDCSIKDIPENIIFPATPFYVKQIVKHFKAKKKGDIIYKIPGYDAIIVPSGIGAPSAAMYIEALRRANIKRILRIDFAGSLSKEVGPGKFFIPEKAILADGTSRAYLPNREYGYPSKDLLDMIKKVLEKLGFEYETGIIYSHDLLFLEDPESIEHMVSKGAKAVDMETGLVYALGELFKIDVIALLIISNYALEGFEKEISSIESSFFEGIDKSFHFLKHFLLEISKL